MGTMQDLHTVGLNPFAVQLLAESMLKSRLAEMYVDGPFSFFFPVQRSDCPGWCGVQITIQAMPIPPGCDGGEAKKF